MHQWNSIVEIVQNRQRNFIGAISCEPIFGFFFGAAIINLILIFLLFGAQIINFTLIFDAFVDFRAWKQIAKIEIVYFLARISPSKKFLPASAELFSLFKRKNFQIRKFLFSPPLPSPPGLVLCGAVVGTVNLAKVFIEKYKF